MKKILLSSFFIFSLLACTSTNLTTKDFFVESTHQFQGGFENSGYSTISKIVTSDNNSFLIENTKDSATNVQRIYLLNEDKILLLFTGENPIDNLDSLNLDNGEIVLQAPFRVGEKWISNSNTYEIISVGADEIQVKKSFPSGIKEITTYKKGEWKIKRDILQ